MRLRTVVVVGFSVVRERIDYVVGEHKRTFLVYTYTSPNDVFTVIFAEAYIISRFYLRRRSRSVCRRGTPSCCDRFIFRIRGGYMNSYCLAENTARTSRTTIIKGIFAVLKRFFIIFHLLFSF